MAKGFYCNILRLVLKVTVNHPLKTYHSTKNPSIFVAFRIDPYTNVWLSADL